MRSLAAFLCFLALVCGNNPGETLLAAPFAVFPPIEPVPTQVPRSTPMPAPQVIAVGEQVTATLPLTPCCETPEVTELLFELTAPSDGTLLVDLSWEVYPGLGSSLTLQLEDVVFDYWPPIVGTLQVVAGQTYRVAVLVEVDPWWLWDPIPFVLTTSIEAGLVDVPLGCQIAPHGPDWVCVDGGWVPPDHPLAQSGAAPPAPPPPSDGATSCLTTRPVTDWVCVGGGWVPPDHPLAIANPRGSPPPPPAPAPPVVGPVGCTSLRPAATWVCVNGGWLPPDHPLAVSAAANPAPPSPQPPPPSGCTTPDPFIGIPGLIGVCVGGGWVPVGHPLAGGGG
jgi:hypothetical protein